MPVEQLFNWFEAGLWITLAAVVFVIGTHRARAGRTASSRLHLIAWPALVVFGISDVIEVHTGAWWSPWWLLLLKGLCLGTLMACGAAWWRSSGRVDR